MRRLMLASMLLLLTPFSGCRQRIEDSIEAKGWPQSQENSNIRFEDVALQAGVNFIPLNGQEAGHYSILESLGTGVGICDFDCDGELDFIVAGGGVFNDTGVPVGKPAGLFRKLAAWKFYNVIDLAQSHSSPFYSHGIIVGDWNSDGFADYLITGYKGLLAWENCGDGTFLDVTDRLFSDINGWYTSGAFGDFDNDGLLDLFLLRYVDWSPDKNAPCYVRGSRDVCPPGEYVAELDQLWMNQCNGTFLEQGAARGIVEAGKGLAALAGDIDLDGDTDLYIANDTTPNQYYVNDGAGNFEEQGLISGTALGMTAEAEGSMGIELADLNNDLLPDLWVSNYENQSFALYQGQAPGIFQHVSDVTGITAVGQVYVGFGTVALDAELDGDLDLFATNGHVMYHARNTAIRQQPLLFENRQGTKFLNVANEAGKYTNSPHLGRGLGAADFDHNGLEDLVVAHTNEPLAILRNISQPQGNWLTLRLIGRKSNRDAIGGTVIARTNQKEQIRFLRGGGSYLSSHSKEVTFGFAPDETLVELEIRWPGGKTELFKTKLNQFVRYTESP